MVEINDGKAAAKLFTQPNAVELGELTFVAALVVAEAEKTDTGDRTDAGGKAAFATERCVMALAILVMRAASSAAAAALASTIIAAPAVVVELIAASAGSDTAGAGRGRDSDGMTVEGRFERGRGRTAPPTTTAASIAGVCCSVSEGGGDTSAAAGIASAVAAGVWPLDVGVPAMSAEETAADGRVGGPTVWNAAGAEAAAAAASTPLGALYDIPAEARGATPARG